MALFIVTVDVEADDAWNKPECPQVTNLQALPEFQRLCNAFGIIPTYLHSYETLHDPRYVAFVQKCLEEEACEVGIHPHVWTIPPFSKETTGVDIPVLRWYQSQLDESTLFAKLECLHDAVHRAFGVQPRSHRAGRWGICSRTVRWLSEHGYVADSSVVPLKSFKDLTVSTDIYPDFMKAPCSPYRMSDNDVLKPGDLDLVEIPVTTSARIVLRSVVRMVDNWRLKRGGVRLKRFLIRKSLYPLELRPYPEYLSGTLPRLAAMSLSKHQVVINLMLHSSELKQGTSPYSSDALKTKKTWQHIKEMFSFVQDNKIPSVGISQAARRLKEMGYFA